MTKVRVIKSPDKAVAELEGLTKRLNGVNGVKVGLPKNSNAYPDGTSVIAVGLAHEFGALIKHPGGTDYGFATEDDEEENRVRFLKKGTGFMVLGTTEPHPISIPQRSFLRATMLANRGKYRSLFAKLAKQIVDGKMTKQKALGIVGLTVQGDVIARMTRGIGPPLKHREGTPLIDTGHLRQSITFQLDDI